MAMNLNFNSIKVRLEQDGDKLNNKVDNYFNSIKVRLELGDDSEAVTLTGISIP